MFILKNLRFDNIEMSVSTDSQIAPTIKEAIAIAKTYHCLVTFTFNGSRIVIDAGSSIESAVRHFYRYERPLNRKDTAD